LVKNNIYAKVLVMKQFLTKLKSRKKTVLLTIIIVFLISVLWPVKFILAPQFLFGRTLVLFTNEAEARPCGGFLSAFGSVKFFPPEFEMKNSYAILDSFGEARIPLRKISNKKNFWDLGDTPDLEKCSDNFQKAFEESINKKVKNVILIDFSTIEGFFNLFGGTELYGEKWTSENLFAKMSRRVADIDRHDEEILEKRKTPLAEIGKKMIRKAVFRPDLWPRATRLFRENLIANKIFISDVSLDFLPKENDFSVIEWNLGGAKSSRFLRKSLKISLREVENEEWRINLGLRVENVGGIDEPLSQDWLGVFELRLPAFLKMKTILLDTKISPGAVIEKSFSFNYSGKLAGKDFGVFVPRGSKVLTDVSISLFPQKTFQTTNFTYHENVGEFFGEMDGVRKSFEFTEVEDKIAPFITLHEPIKMENIPENLKAKWGKFFAISSRRFWPVEIHFSEKINLDNFRVKCTDRNFENAEITDNPEFEMVELLPDGRSILIGFWQKIPQQDERFWIEISGLTDEFGNEILPARRTVIDR
jgi:hypothetical protein